MGGEQEQQKIQGNTSVKVHYGVTHTIESYTKNLC